MNILFLCTGNSCRSQMAEAFAKNIWKDKYTFYSAGTRKSEVNKNAIKVMDELNIDMTSHFSKTISDLKDVKMDLIFTVCGHANESCPYFPGGKVIHLGFDDPPELENQYSEDDKLIPYIRVRGEIKQFILNLEKYIEEL